MAIDKTLPNVEQEITIPSEEEQLVEQVEEQQEVAENPLVDVQENEDGSVDISYDPATASIEGGENHYSNLAEHLPDDI